MRARIAASIAYDKQHAEACAAVLPIIGQIVRDADHAGWCVSYDGGIELPHWRYTDLVLPMGSGYPLDISAMAQGYDACGYSCKSYWQRITEITSRLCSYPWLASWLCG